MPTSGHFLGPWATRPAGTAWNSWAWYLGLLALCCNLAAAGAAVYMDGCRNGMRFFLPVRPWPTRRHAARDSPWPPHYGLALCSLPADFSAFSQLGLRSFSSTRFCLALWTGLATWYVV